MTSVILFLTLAILFNDLVQFIYGSRHCTDFAPGGTAGKRVLGVDVESDDTMKALVRNQDCEDLRGDEWSVCHNLHRLHGNDNLDHTHTFTLQPVGASGRVSAVLLAIQQQNIGPSTFCL